MLQSANVKICLIFLLKKYVKWNKYMILSSGLWGLRVDVYIDQPQYINARQKTWHSLALFSYFSSDMLT